MTQSCLTGIRLRISENRRLSRQHNNGDEKIHDLLGIDYIRQIG